MKKIFSKGILKALFIIPLFLRIRPRSYIAHDEGYYILQSRAILDSGNWLAPTSWGAPVFDRTIGAQWIIAGCQKLFGYTSWSSHLPSLIFGLVSLLLTYLLAKKFFGVSVATISAGILLLSPIFLDYTHLATQDMPLLAIELIGIYSLAMAENRKDDVHHLFSGMWIGMGFLMKGFMIFLPLIAIIPLILWRKKYLISSRLFLLGLFVGWLPVIIWISLSIREYGYTVVSNLFNKLIYLSGESTFAKGHFYYLWNIPLFTLPWCIFFIHPLLHGVRNWRDDRLFIFVVYPLLLTFLLSCFKTKTTYYGLQMTPYISILAAYSTILFDTHRILRKRLISVVNILGICLIVAAIVFATGFMKDYFVIDAYVFMVIMAILLIISVAWTSLNRRENIHRVFAKLMLSQWIAMLILVQGGFLTDRSTVIRSALSDNHDFVRMNGNQKVSFVEAKESLSVDARKKRILIALAMKKLNHTLVNNHDLLPGDIAWINEVDIDAFSSGELNILYSKAELSPWILVAKN